MRRFALIALCVCLAATASAASLFFDFGETAQPTGGNYNNISQAQLPIFNALDSLGNGTGISVEVTDQFWPGSNQSGTTTPAGDAAMFDPQATRDNLFGNTVAFGGFTEPTAQLTLSNLNTSGAISYNFTFFGSRMGVTDNRETAYAVTGATSATAYLNTSGNTSNVAIAAGVVPTAGGQITINIGPGPNNNNSSGFYYLGAMRIDVVPEPATALLLGLGLLVRRR